MLINTHTKKKNGYKIFVYIKSINKFINFIKIKLLNFEET